jgi:hypothetical protein
MIGYVTVGTNDFERAIQFYDELLAIYGCVGAIEATNGAMCDNALRRQLGDCRKWRHDRSESWQPGAG